MNIPSDSDFDWYDDETVVLREQPATAVYQNCRNEVVIRQCRAWDEDTDTIILLQPRNARAIANALLATAAYLEAQDNTTPESRELSNAQLEDLRAARDAVTIEVQQAARKPAPGISGETLSLFQAEE